MALTKIKNNIIADNAITADKIDQTSLNSAGFHKDGDSVTYENITVTGELRGPASFIIDPAAHGDNTGAVSIKGDLVVEGTTFTANATTVDIADINLTIANNAPNPAAADGAGITIDGANATLLYNATDDTLDFNKGINVGSDSIINSNLTVLGNGVHSIGWGNTEEVGRLTYSGTAALVLGSTGKDLVLGANTAGVLRIDTNGNVGIHQTPPSGAQIFDYFYVNNMSINGTSTEGGLFRNSYYNNSTYKSLKGGTSSRIYMASDGAFLFERAATALADQPITYETLMKITEEGNLELGPFEFDKAADRFTITNNTNTGGIDIVGDNARVYFNGVRGLEHALSTNNLLIGEQLSNITLQAPTKLAMGASGATPYQGGNEGLTIENNSRAAINLLSPQTHDSYVFFGTPNAGNRGYVGYENSNERLVIKSHGDVHVNADKLTVDTTDSNGRLTLNQSGEETISIIDSRTATSGRFQSGIKWRDYQNNATGGIFFEHNEYFGSTVRSLIFKPAGSSEKMRLNADGKLIVGAGTENGNITIRAEADRNWLELINNSESAFGFNIYNDGTNQGTTVPFIRAGLHYGGNLNSAIHFYRGGSGTGGFLAFTTDTDIERMRITTEGRFGFRTTTPDEDFSFRTGSADWRLYGSGTDLRLFDPKSTSATRKLVFLNTGSGANVNVDFESNILTQRYLGGGALYRAYGGSSTELQLRTGIDGDWTSIGNFSGHELRIRTDNTDRMTVKETTGNVGINTTAPRARLHVKGASLVSRSDENIEETTVDSGFSLAEAGEITLVLQVNGTIPANATLVFEYAASTWKSWQLEVTVSNTMGFAHYVGGGYNNGGISGYLTEVADPNTNITSAAMNTAPGNQGNRFTFGLRQGGIHTTIKIKYSQGGGDGPPRADKCRVRVQH